MNTIILKQGKIEKQIDKNIIISLEDKEKFLGVKTLKIIIKKNNTLKIIYETEEKLDIYINIEENVNCNLIEYKKGKKYKIAYKYYLEKNSELNLIKINDVNQIKESLIFNLNGNSAKVNTILKTISKDEEKYNFYIYHNHSNTYSNIINHGVNINEGKLKFDITGFVPKGKTKCILNQNNRIINLTDSKCEIKPILLIDENDVIANHSAHIGKCKDEDIFYLQSRGITKKDAEKLLIKGFLLKNLNEEKEYMENIINEYFDF